MLNKTPESPNSRFHVMAKPTGALCNLNCDYCFYLHKQNLLETSNKWRMSDEILEQFVKQYIQGQNHNESCSICADPFERADRESIGYSKWRVEHAYAILPAVASIF